jgi:hypothetical protein
MGHRTSVDGTVEQDCPLDVTVEQDRGVARVAAGLPRDVGVVWSFDVVRA